LRNAGTGLAPSPQASRATTAGYTGRLVAAIARGLERSRQAGILAEDTPVAPLARATTTTLLGVFAMMRAQAGPVVLQDAASQAIAALERHRVAA
jgi:hypothetical protein